MAVVQMSGGATVGAMLRRFVLLAVPLALVLPACSSDDSPSVGGDDTTTTTKAGATTTSVDSSTSSIDLGLGIKLSGPEGTTGSFKFSVKSDRSEFCYRIAISGAGTANASHIHRLTGESVLTLTPLVVNGPQDTCVASDALLIDELQASPNRFYLDVHTEKGLLRGNLG